MRTYNVQNLPYNIVIRHAGLKVSIFTQVEALLRSGLVAKPSANDKKWKILSRVVLIKWRVSQYGEIKEKGGNKTK